MSQKKKNPDTALADIIERLRALRIGRTTTAGAFKVTPSPCESYKIAKSDTSPCRNCVFFEHNTALRAGCRHFYLACMAHRRKDHESVIFKKV